MEGYIRSMLVHQSILDKCTPANVSHDVFVSAGGRRVWQVNRLKNPSPGLTMNPDLNRPWLVLSSPEEQAVWILDLTLISWEHVVQPSVTHVEHRQTLELNVFVVGQPVSYFCLFVSSFSSNILQFWFSSADY